MKEKTKEQFLCELKALQKRIIELENKWAESKQREDEVRECKERFQLLANTTFDAVWDWDLVTSKVVWNEGVKTLFKYSAAEVGFDVNWWKERIHPEDKERVISGILAAIEGAEKTWSDEYRFRRGNGSYASVIDRGYIVYKEDGKPTRMISAMMDITERNKSEKKLEALNKELLKSNRILKLLTLRDPHTGLYNHRYLGEFIEAEFYRAKRHALPISMIMLDIDYFKSINDVYGHPFGDLVLKQLARVLKRMVRRYDTIVRYGGEEFIIISSGIDRPGALTLGQRLLDAINLYNFGDKKHIVNLKISIAVASYPEDKMIKGINLVELADQILNKVKEDGGDRVYSSLDLKKKKLHTLERAKETPDVKSLKCKIEKLTKRANQSLVEAVFAFAKTIKIRDHYTGEHVERIVYFATEVARVLGLSKGEIERIRQASILHDLGKVGISDKILLKKAKLTKTEFEEIKRHPQIGADIIRPIHFLHGIIPMILYHHERWDARGYPHGLRGEDIPMGARIVAISDVYQALISDRPYRKAYSEDTAVEIIKDSSGSQFDPRVVRAFLKILQQ